ncbi:hypothetical protein GN958_ATG00749 [Phytophthora infestans]|uniref:Uncharacterized protein n=1 Tax=Phytophthora infestans TaxID=4787 RepID=A0A8S9VBS2_PHYIN|nr:hypothetical protein GN958_ATG00749 [Phytophthora infestans]
MAHIYNLQRLHFFNFSAIMEATTDEIKAAAWVMEKRLVNEKQEEHSIFVRAHGSRR